MARAIQTFEVSLKAFIVREGLALFVREADSGYWELPGGRIDVGEEWQAQEEVLEREIAEELGAGFHATFGPEAVTWVRQRPSDGAFLFLVARLGQAGPSEPQLSDEHSEMRWAGPEASAQLSFPEASGYPEAIHRLWQLAGRKGRQR